MNNFLAIFRRLLAASMKQICITLIKIHTYKACMYNEMRVNADSYDQQHRRYRAHLDAYQSERAQELHSHRGAAKNDQRSGPHVKQHHADDQEDDTQRADHSQIQILSQTLVLLPEDERNAGWEVG